MAVIVTMALLHAMGVGVPVTGHWIFSMSTPSETSAPDNGPQADQGSSPVLPPPAEQDSGSESSQTSTDPAEALETAEERITRQSKALEDWEKSLQQKATELQGNQEKLSLDQQNHARLEADHNAKVDQFRTQTEEIRRAQADQRTALDTRRTVLNQEKARPAGAAAAGPAGR